MKEIPLSRGLVAIVDDEDFEWLSRWKWSTLKVGRPNAEPKFYAIRTTKKGDPRGAGKAVLMHRQIKGEPDGMVVDHRNLNTLDCRWNNLRVTTQALNCLNQRGHSDRGGSRYKGVYWHGQNKNWCASFRGKYIGSFADEMQAAAAYDAAALAFSADFALTNMDMGVAA